jgi:ribonuclease HI
MPDDTPAERAIIYTDGSCIGNPGPGGWGVHAELPDGRVLELGGGELETTNNRMELRAAIEALRLARATPAATIVTDSTYVQRGVTRWLAIWTGNGWKTSAGQPVENQALWRELAELLDERVAWQWTRAHVGTAGNERVDQIARSFSQGIRPLQPSTGRARSASAALPASARGGGATYLSVVDGVPMRHATWPECEQRVRGIRGALFKKVRGPDEERAAMERWGLSPGELDYL